MLRSSEFLAGREAGTSSVPPCGNREYLDVIEAYNLDTKYDDAVIREGKVKVFGYGFGISCNDYVTLNENACVVFIRSDISNKNIPVIILY